MNKTSRYKTQFVRYILLCSVAVASTLAQMNRPNKVQGGPDSIGVSGMVSNALPLQPIHFETRLKAQPSLSPLKNKTAPVSVFHRSPVQQETFKTQQAPHVQSSSQPTEHMTTTNVKISNKTQSSEDLYWLSRVIEAEAGAEPQDVKIAVGDVIVNRTHSTRYPNTVHDVIFQYAYGVYEFTSVENGWIYHEPSAASIAAAKTVLNQHINLVPNALVFYNASKTSTTSWVRKQPYLTTIGSMTFAV